MSSEEEDEEERPEGYVMVENADEAAPEDSEEEEL